MMKKNYLLHQIKDLKQSPEQLYRIITEIGIYNQLIAITGKGSFGRVYKGINIITDQIVSIKILNIQNNELKESHINEIQMLKLLKHPNILKLYDVYLANEYLWIVTEYCHYGSIYDIIQITGLTFSEGEIACIIFQILQGLHFCHSKDIIHRDLKTANILLNTNGIIKISDFGLAINATASDQFIGSPYYMSPEQIHKQKYTKAIDIWQLGISLIEMYEGQTPYSNISPNNVLYTIKNHPATSFTDPEFVSQDINQFLYNFLQINPQQRLSAEEIINDKFFQAHKQYIEYTKKNMCEVRKILLEKHKQSQIIKNSLPFSKVSSFIDSSFDETSKVKSFLLQNNESHADVMDSQFTQRKTKINKKISNSWGSNGLNGNITNNLSINFIRISDPKDNKIEKINLKCDQLDIKTEKKDLESTIKITMSPKKKSLMKQKPVFKLQINKVQQDDNHTPHSNRTQGETCSFIMKEQPPNTIKNCNFKVKHKTIEINQSTQNIINTTQNVMNTTQNNSIKKLDIFKPYNPYQQNMFHTSYNQPLHLKQNFLVESQSQYIQQSQILYKESYQKSESFYLNPPKNQQNNQIKMQCPLKKSQIISQESLNPSKNPVANFLEKSNQFGKKNKIFDNFSSAQQQLKHSLIQKNNDNLQYVLNMPNTERAKVNKRQMSNFELTNLNTERYNNNDRKKTFIF